MNKFFVGQRVKIDCPQSGNHGAETTIRSLETLGRNFNGRDFIGAQVNIPMEKKEWAVDFPFCVHEYHELIPLYDGRQKVSFEECLWKPQGEIA